MGDCGPFDEVSAFPSRVDVVHGGCLMQVVCEGDSEEVCSGCISCN